MINNNKNDFPELDLSRVSHHMGNNTKETPTVMVGTFHSPSIKVLDTIRNHTTPSVMLINTNNNEVETLNTTIKSEISNLIKENNTIPEYIHPYLYHYIGKNNPLADKVISFFKNFESLKSNPFEDLYRFSLIKKYIIFMLSQNDETMANKILAINKLINATEKRITQDFKRKCEHIKINQDEDQKWVIDNELHDSLEQLFSFLRTRCNAITRMLKHPRKVTNKTLKRADPQELIRNIDNEQKLMHLETRDTIFKPEYSKTNFQAVKEVELAKSEEIAMKLAKRRREAAAALKQNNPNIKQP